ncbi:MAG: DUF6508 domain-containing protein [Deltaproteobacteria bacterium]
MAADPVAEILRFQQLFESPGFIFGQVVAPPGAWGHVAMATDVDDFVDALYDNGWVAPFEGGSFQAQAEEYFEKPDRLDTADLDTLRRLLTLHVRKDRFADGHLLSMFQTGHMQAILRRLRSLHES